MNDLYKALLQYIKSVATHAVISLGTLKMSHPRSILYIGVRLNFPPYVYSNFVYQNLMYIEGCNTIKWRDVKLALGVSIHRYSIENVQ